MAERDNVRLGAVCLVQARDEVTEEPLEGVGQLRLLIVDPAARGLGVGGRLVAEMPSLRAIGGLPARATVDKQPAGCGPSTSIGRRAISLVGTEAFEGFGQSLVGETWVLDLIGTDAA